MADPTDREQPDPRIEAAVDEICGYFGVSAPHNRSRMRSMLNDLVAGRDRAVLPERDTYGEEYHRCYCEQGVDHVSDL